MGSQRNRATNRSPAAPRHRAARGEPKRAAAGPLHQLPEGLRDWLPREALRLRRAESLLIEQFRRWGYLYVIPPSFEFLDNFLIGDSQWSPEDFLKFEDRSSGRLLAVRADFTPQLARIASTLMGEAPLPYRFCYTGPVVRHLMGRQDTDREMRQAGVELIGAANPEADAELMTLLAQSLAALGLTDLTLDIGNPAVFRSLCEAVGLEPAAQRDLQKLLHSKEAAALPGWIAARGVRPRAARAIRALADCYGGPEVLKEVGAALRGLEKGGGRPSTATARLRGALGQVEEVVAILQSNGLDASLSVDLGDVSAFHYHNGATFRVYHPSSAVPLGGGGRYDGLLAAYAFDQPASGFAVDMETIARLAPEAEGGEAIDAVVAAIVPAARPSADRAAQAMRALGLRVARWIDGSDMGKALTQAKALGAVLVKVHPSAKGAADERARAEVIDPSRPGRRDAPIPLKNLLDRLREAARSGG